MLMSVVKLVVLATQENFDRERESKIGQQCAVSSACHVLWTVNNEVIVVFSGFKVLHLKASQPTQLDRTRAMKTRHRSRKLLP